MIESRSPSQIIWRKLRRNRTAMAGLYVLGGLYLAAIFAGFLAPYKYDNADHDAPFHPPMLARIHWFDEEGRFSRPFVYGITPEDVERKTFGEDRARRYPIRLLARGDGYHIFWVIRSNVHLFGV